MSGPWENYQPAESSGAAPWEKYGGGGPTAGGVQDYEPIKTRHVGTTERTTGLSDYLGTQLVKGMTGIASIPRAMADAQRFGSRALGVPEGVSNALVWANPITAVGQFGPTSNQMNRFVTEKIGMPDVGSGSKVLDAGVQAAMTAPAMPGNALRNALPLFMGGAASEGAGQATEGTPYEIPARVIGGVVAGGGTAALQNAGGSIIQGAHNLISPNVPETAGKIIGRGLLRDEMTGPQFEATHRALGPNALAIEAGGQNMEGALRGSIAAPGKARTTVNTAFDKRLEGADTATEGLIGKTVSNLPPVSTRVNALEEARSAASGPAYEAAGIPRERNALKSADRIMGSDDLLVLFRDSPDVQAALRNARKVPELKGEPINSMAVLDRVYKHIGGLEQAQRGPGGNRVRADDLADIRKRLAAAIGEENPAYTKALSTYSEPSKLIDAAELGQKLFKSGTNDAEIGRVYKALPLDQQQEFRGGLAQYLRDKINRTDRTSSAERLWTGGENERNRLKAVLGKDFDAFAKEIETYIGASQKNRAITSGSRTTPMALEAADNAGMNNALVSAGTGRFKTAMAQALGVAYNRLAEGRTEKVNAEVARLLTSTDPKDVGLVAALAERARLAEAAKSSGRRNALLVGAGAPVMRAGQ